MVEIHTDRIGNERILETASPSRLSPALIGYFIGLIGLTAGAGSAWLALSYPDLTFYWLSTGAGISLMGVILIMKTEAAVRFTKYYLTDRRVVKEYKFVRMSNDILRYEDVVEVAVSSSGLEKPFGVKTIGLMTPTTRRRTSRTGRPIPDLELKWLKNPEKLENTVTERINRDKGKRRI